MTTLPLPYDEWRRSNNDNAHFTTWEEYAQWNEERTARMFYQIGARIELLCDNINILATAITELSQGRSVVIETIKREIVTDQ